VERQGSTRQAKTCQGFDQRKKGIGESILKMKYFENDSLKTLGDVVPYSDLKEDSYFELTKRIESGAMP